MAGLKAAVLPVTPFQQNCTLLWDETSKDGAIVDPGGDVDRILEAVEKLTIRPELILLTHGHLDHAGGATVLQSELSKRAGRAIPIHGPDERDRFLLAELEQQGAQFGFSGLRNVTPDRWLKEGDRVTVAGQTFAVLHCPGHTPGHIVFVDHASRFALVGDVLFRGSIGRTDFPYGDTQALLQSIDEKLLPLGDDITFICGHGPASTIGEERHSNPFLRELPRSGSLQR